MQEFVVESWEDFTERLADVSQGLSKSPSPLLFRGLHDSTWQLTTTLERNGNVNTSFLDYFRVIKRVKSQVETMTRNKWGADTISQIDQLVYDDEQFHVFLSRGKLRSYAYMVWLRHHGFPSPLLDWTRSPYIAAFFAFQRAVQPSSGRVAIFAYCESPKGEKAGGGGDPIILSFGRYVRTARRHFLQQAEYTMCLRFDQKWQFTEHERVFTDDRLYRQDQDMLWKFTIPWEERRKVLKHLDDHGLNALSLFESDEALLETLAFRELVPGKVVGV